MVKIYSFFSYSHLLILKSEMAEKKSIHLQKPGAPSTVEVDSFTQSSFGFQVCPLCLWGDDSLQSTRKAQKRSSSQQCLEDTSRVKRCDRECRDAEGCSVYILTSILCLALPSQLPMLIKASQIPTTTCLATTHKCTFHTEA